MFWQEPKPIARNYKGKGKTTRNVSVSVRGSVIRIQVKSTSIRAVIPVTAEFQVFSNTSIVLKL
jgi:hypothetical protein